MQILRLALSDPNRVAKTRSLRMTGAWVGADEDFNSGFAWLKNGMGLKRQRQRLR